MMNNLLQIRMSVNHGKSTEIRGDYPGATMSAGKRCCCGSSKKDITQLHGVKAKAAICSRARGYK